MVCDALGRAPLPPPRVRRVAGLDFLCGPLPAAAYRLLLDFLRFDHGWCHYVTPVFSLGGWVTLHLNAAETREVQSESRGRCSGKPLPTSTMRASRGALAMGQATRIAHVEPGRLGAHPQLRAGADGDVGNLCRKPPTLSEGVEP